MSKTLTLNLNRSLLIEAVKADTYITGDVEKASAQNAEARAYAEQAGDDVYHERKLVRSLRTAVSLLEAHMLDFVDSTSGSTIADTLASSSAQSPAFTITMTVSDRFHSGQATPLASLAQEFIINNMLMAWWQPINQKLSSDYAALMNNALSGIHLCLAKVAPTPSASNYDSVNGTVANS